MARPAVLVFSRTAGYRHESIPAGVAAIRRLGEDAGLTVAATEDAATFTRAELSRFRAVVWLSTSGTVLDEPQRRAFEAYVADGGGYVGVHGAADTEYDWPWYGGLVGAYFRSHPDPQPATVRVLDRAHPATAHLDATWTRFDEWYDYQALPGPGVRVLMTLDEASYQGGVTGGQHPIAWCHGYRGGRSFYTGLGHTAESYDERAFLAHLRGGILWAASFERHPSSGRCSRLTRRR